MHNRQGGLGLMKWGVDKDDSSRADLHTVPKEINFPRYNMKCGMKSEIQRRILCVISRFPLHFVLYFGNFDYFFYSVHALSLGGSARHLAWSVCCSTCPSSSRSPTSLTRRWTTSTSPSRRTRYRVKESVSVGLVQHLTQGDGLHQPLQAEGQGIGLKRQSQWG